MSKETDIILSLNKTLNNPITRNILRYLSRKNRLEDSLELLVGIKEKSGIGCRMNSFLVGTAIKYGAKAFGRNDTNFLKYFRDITTRKGLVNVLRGIAKYGITKPQKLYAPFLVVWDFTSMCNLRCKHCYSSAGKLAPDELSKEERYNVIDQLSDAGVVAVAFSGGEPLISKDFFDIAKYAHEKEMYVSVASNGTLITKEVAKKLREIGVGYIEISLDSTDFKIHDQFRGVKGAWEKTVQGIKNCVEVGITTCIATTTTRYNYEDIPNMIDLAIKLKVDRFIHFNFIPTGTGKEIIDQDILPEQREKLLNYLYDKLEEDNGLQVFSTAPQFARVSLERVESGKGKDVTPTHFAGVSLKGKAIALADFIGGCGAGRIYCSIEYNGDIQPCVFMPIKVGNIREGFLNLWQNSEILNKLRNREDLKGECHDCPYRYVCGGCRARAYAYFNDIKAPDPGCIKNIDYWDEIEGEEVIGKKEEILVTA
ncbi:MAG: radical SAM protein [Methanomicrobia archaeon]|nr:radical SAM protein [Methanomicrobia archaeon]